MNITHLLRWRTPITPAIFVFLPYLEVMRMTRRDQPGIVRFSVNRNANRVQNKGLPKGGPYFFALTERARKKIRTIAMCAVATGRKNDAGSFVPGRGEKNDCRLEKQYTEGTG
ncbi:MAG: hypothetical protein IIU02_07885 [Treponema sp.]|uniref:hypothetical protein n=2 Tax=Treponema TaxID=157 RepID=UPI00257ED14F|nr:hypothetical protein [Treponema sp.]MBQ5537812.1 hypothetical protein [Treponema sp.]